MTITKLDRCAYTNFNMWTNGWKLSLIRVTKHDLDKINAKASERVLQRILNAIEQNFLDRFDISIYHDLHSVL